jgi:hypothetical protein
MLPSMELFIHDRFVCQSFSEDCLDSARNRQSFEMDLSRPSYAVVIWHIGTMRNG